MGMKPLPPGLNVILGDSAAGTFDEALGARESLLIDHDVLSCGPTRRCDSLVDWQAMRRQYWDELVPMASHEPPPTDRDLLEHARRLRDADQLIVWAATSVSEQLFIAHVLHHAEEAGLDPARIHIVPFEKLPNSRARLMGMGELNATQLRDHPEPRPLTPDELRDYLDAWVALTSDDPHQLADFARTHGNANTWLNRAMQLMLRRFPDQQSGITFWDRELLDAVREHSPRAARVVGYTMTKDWDDADLTGDWYLFGRMLRMARLPTPLLEISGDAGNMRATEVKLTPFGLDVLERRASNYPANPIEDWAAGVRLSSRDGALWFNDAGRLVRG